MFDQKNKKYINPEGLNLLYNNLTVSVLSYILAGLIISFFLRSHFDSGKVLWLSLLLCISLIRLTTILIFNKNKSPGTSLFYFLFIIELIISSLIWGFSGFALLSDDILENMLLTVCIMGLAAGGITSLSSERKTLFIFLSLLLFPFAVRLFLFQSELYTLIGILLILFFVLISFIGLRLNRMIRENLQYKEKHKKTMEELAKSENSFRSIFEHAPVGFFYYDKNLIINEFNDEFSRILDTTNEKLTNFNLQNINNKEVLNAIKKPLENVTGQYEGEYTSLLSSRKIWVIIVCSPLYDDNNNISGAVGIVQDRTEMQLIEEQVRHLAYHDSLTGLPNRRLLIDRLEQALSSSGRHNQFGALLFLDLDNFKKINDTLGHHIGDLILKETAERIISILRTEDTVARIGGDEFVIILPRLHSNSESSAVAVSLVSDKIHSILSEPFRHLDNTLYTSTSIGVVIFSNEDNNSDILMKNADTAMYEAKRAGRSRTHYFTEEMNISMEKRLILEKNLRQAIEKNELVPYFQPIYNQRSSAIIGAETLLRWKHPEMGMISPVDFIPLAEETNLIIPIGEWLIEEVCRILSEWKRKFPEHIEYVSINISVKQLQKDNFVEIIEQNLERYNIPPHLLVLEITENILIKNFDRISQTVSKLRQKGLRFALDDFGTGYSSLTYLKKLELDIIKIDRSFIMDIVNDKYDSALVEAILSIAENFQMKVIAEGVEEKNQIEHLTAMGCSYFQGFYYSRPIPPDEFEKIIKS